jgi:divalent metal cation (Fe/Co/Zn/Cd) transporter
MDLTAELDAEVLALLRVRQPELTETGMSMHQLGWLIGAGIVGFVGNEIVAVLRIRTGRRINSAALIADGFRAEGRRLSLHQENRGG